jgi:MIP family channel proteins
MNQTLFKQCVAEFVGTATLIFVGIGAIYNDPGLLGVALAHGLAIAVMVSATGGISGGHLNPAVTFGLLVGGIVDGKKAVAYWISQLAGATFAALLCVWLLGGAAVAAGTPDIGVNHHGVPPDLDTTGGTPMVSFVQAVAVEAVLTFFLVFVVYGTAVDSRAPKIGGLAIGLTITLDILFGGPLTGGSMNPARTFGPALAVGHWHNHAVYWIGPMLGGLLAGIVYGRFLIKPAEKV